MRHWLRRFLNDWYNEINRAILEDQWVKMTVYDDWDDICWITPPQKPIFWQTFLKNDNIQLCKIDQICKAYVEEYKSTDLDAVSKKTGRNKWKFKDKQGGYKTAIFETPVETVKAKGIMASYKSEQLIWHWCAWHQRNNILKKKNTEQIEESKYLKQKTVNEWQKVQECKTKTKQKRVWEFASPKKMKMRLNKYKSSHKLY